MREALQDAADIAAVRVRQEQTITLATPYYYATRKSLAQDKVRLCTPMTTADMPPIYMALAHAMSLERNQQNVCRGPVQ